MAATRGARPERFITLALLAAGLSVAVIGLLGLLGWELHVPLLTTWKVGGIPMAPITAVLSVLFGATLCLEARRLQGRVALLLITVFGWMGALACFLLLALHLMGVFSSTELLGLRFTGMYGGVPIGYISPITAFCFLLAYGSLLDSLPNGVRGSMRVVLLWGFGLVVLVLSFTLLLAHAFSAPLPFSKVLIYPALNTNFVLLIMGLAQLVIAARYTWLPASPADTNNMRMLPYIVVFLVFAAGTIAVAYYFYRSTELRFRQEMEAELLTVSELKTEELVRWRRERFWDATLSQNPGMTGAVRRLLETPQSVPVQRELRDLLDKYQRYIGYDRVFLLDSKGVTRMSVPDTAGPADAVLRERAAVSLRTGQVMLQDFYRDEHDQRVYLALMVPILDQQGSNRPLGVVVLRIDPEIYLYQHIKSWPTPSASAETLLVRREGNDVLFLNELRFRANAALALRFPLIGNTQLPAVKAVLGQSGIVEGLDYRGVPVIAAVRAVPDSPWHIVTRVDKAEVYAPLRERMWLTVLLTSVLVCGAGTVAILLWRQQRLAFYRRQLELTSALRESEEWHQSILRTSINGFWLVNTEGRLLEVNDAYCRMSGYSEEELLFKHVSELEAVETVEEVDAHIQLVEERGEDRFETRHRRKDGSLFDVEVSVKYQAIGGGRCVVFLQDITRRKMDEKTIKASKAQLDFALQKVKTGAWELNLRDHTAQRTLLHDSIFGYEKMLPCWTYEKFLEHVLPEDRSRVDLRFREAIGAQADWSFECRIRRADGDVRWIYAAGDHIRNAKGEPELISGIVQDITERKQAEIKLQLAASVFTHAREGIMITAADGAIIDVNDAFSEITGYSRDEVLGRTPHLLSSDLQDKEFYEAMWRELIEQGYWHGEVWNLHKNGEVYAVMQTISAVRDEQGNAREYVALFTDITPIKEHEQKLERSAHFDALTGLPNRVLLADRLQQGMVQARRRGQGLAVAFLDLDGFKSINDNHGHEAGDQLLIALATRMKQVLREGDTLARLGGDEFVAVLADIGDIEACAPMLNRLLAAAAEPMQLGEFTLQVSASLGVTFYALADDIDADHLLRQADQAMYQAKMAGKNRYHLFDADQDSRVRSHYEGLERIRRALAEEEFVLYYQPKVNMRTGAVIGAEALIRWQHPEKGLLLPAEFLPAIEDHLLGIQLGDWVIDTALFQMELWQGAGLNIPVSVNVGARQLQHADFVERLRALLAAHPKVSPGDLELEVLETSAVEDLVKVSQVIDASRKLGVSFSLDDFGTGYSSLTYLKRLPVSQLKIDQSFVRDMIDDPDDLSIVEGVIGLASAFRLLVIAEGAETIEHSSILLQLGCDMAQGYGIARPMPAQQLPDWLATWRPDPVWTGLPTFSHDDMPLLLASVEHRAWIVAIEKYLKGERERLPQMDPNQCRFSMWLNADCLKRYGTQPAFQAIEILHGQAHLLAAELCELQSQGRKPEALARLGELHGLRDALFEQLEVLVQGKRQ